MTPAPYIPGSETSKAAADAIEPKLNYMEYEVLRYISERGYTGATDDELAVRFMAQPWNWAAETARARRVKLAKLGYVRESGGPPRLTRRRRWATVWVPMDRAADLFDGREP